MAFVGTGLVLLAIVAFLTAAFLTSWSQGLLVLGGAITLGVVPLLVFGSSLAHHLRLQPAEDRIMLAGRGRGLGWFGVAVIGAALLASAAGTLVMVQDRDELWAGLVFLSPVPLLLLGVGLLVLSHRRRRGGPSLALLGPGQPDGTDGPEKVQPDQLLLSPSGALLPLADHGPDGIALPAGARWLPGGRGALTAWSRDGYQPTVAQARRLRIAARLLPGEVKDAVDPGHGLSLFLLGWLTLLCVLMSAALAWVALVNPQDESGLARLIPAVLAVFPAVGGLILGQRLLRALRPDATGSMAMPASVEPAGWRDHLFGAGLIPWPAIRHLAIRPDGIVLIVRDGYRLPKGHGDLGTWLNGLVYAVQGQPGPRRTLTYPPASGIHPLLPAAENAAAREGRNLGEDPLVVRWPPPS